MRAASMQPEGHESEERSTTPEAGKEEGDLPPLTGVPENFRRRLSALTLRAIITGRRSVTPEPDNQMAMAPVNSNRARRISFALHNGGGRASTPEPDNQILARENNNVGRRISFMGLHSGGRAPTPEPENHRPTSTANNYRSGRFEGNTSIKLSSTEPNNKARRSQERPLKVSTAAGDHQLRAAAVADGQQRPIPTDAEDQQQSDRRTPAGREEWKVFEEGEL